MASRSTLALESPNPNYATCRIAADTGYRKTSHGGGSNQASQHELAQKYQR